MRVVAGVLGALLVAGEVARWWGMAGAFPKAVDDVVAGAVLLGLAFAGGRLGNSWHAAGWALFTGVMLTTLVINLDAWLGEAGKPRAGVYAAVLASLVAIGAGSTLWWARRR